MTTVRLIAFLMCLGVSHPAFAQEDKKDKQAEAPKSDLQQATEELASNIELALKSFTDLNKPAPEKIRQFDTIIGQIEGALDLIKRGGKLHAQVQSAIQLALGKSLKYKLKAKDEEAPEDHKKDYLEVSIKQENNARTAGAFIIAIIEARVDLETQLKYVKRNKEYYIDMVEEKQLAKANKVLSKVLVNMNEVSQALLDLCVKSSKDYMLP